MLSFEDASIPVSKEEILSKISELDIFKRYCSNFVELNKSFCSDLRLDKSPGVRIYTTEYNTVRYKDFASGDHLDCWNYVMRKFNCTYHEALNVIVNDFRIKEMKINLSPRILLSNDEIKMSLNVPRVKASISIVQQPFNLVDYEYWNQFGISLELLEEYNVFSAKYVYLVKGDKRYTYSYSKSNPSYAYRFTRDGNYYYKIYFPKAEKNRKWLFSGGASEDIEGYDQLPLNGELLILTKSLKDCMCFNLIGIPAISLQGEANKLEQELVNKLLKRFDRIVTVYDNDVEGIRGAKRFKQQYDFDYFFIEEAKDLSDLIKLKGLDYSKKMIDDEIKDCLGYRQDMGLSSI